MKGWSVLGARWSAIRRDLRVAAFYALFGIAWIRLSDGMVAAMFADPVLLNRAQTSKGLVFVCLSTLLIFLLLRFDLIQERRAKAALDESEDRYRRLFDNSTEAILMTEPGGAILAANPAACALLGRTEDEIRLIGRSGVVDLEDPRLASALQERARTGRYEGRLTFVRANGERFEAEITSNLYRTNEGKPRTSMFIRDVTDRVRAEEELQHAYATLYTAMDQSHAGIAIADAKGSIQFINQSGLEIGGKPEGDLAVGMDEYVASWNLFHLDGRRMERDEVPLARALLKAEANTLEFVVRQKDGDLVVLTNAAPVRDREGRVVGGVAVFLDVTDRKRDEERLRRLNRMYLLLSQTNQAIVRERDVPRLFEGVCRTAVESGGFAMAWVGLLEGRLVAPKAYCGRGSEYLKGLRVDLDDPVTSQGPTGIALSTGSPVICHEIATDPRMKPWRDAALAQGFGSSAAFPLIVEGETVGCLNLYATDPMAFDEDECRLLEEMAADIGFAMEFALKAERARTLEKEREDAHEQLQALNAELERRVADRTAQLEAANRELEAFSYSVSHDLRAPLRAIDGWAGVLAEDFGEALGEEGLDVLARLRAADKRMGDLIEDLLQLSRVNRHPLELRVFDPSEMVRVVWSEQESAFGNDHAELALSPIPPCRADASLLRQVFANLLGNALKFSGRRDMPVVEVGGSSDGHESVYYVKDNGVGFDGACADKLFQPFHRLHDAREFPGTGIGLAIVQRIVRLHGGRVWAESRQDEGATFFFSLPAGPA